MQGCHIIHNGIKHNFETLTEAQEYIDNLTLPRGSLEIVNVPKIFTLLNEVGAL